MIKNENDYDVDALMTFTIITRPFFFILIYISEIIKEDASILCYSGFRA